MTLPSAITSGRGSSLSERRRPTNRNRPRAAAAYSRLNKPVPPVCEGCALLYRGMLFPLRGAQALMGLWPFQRACWIAPRCFSRCRVWRWQGWRAWSCGGWAADAGVSGSGDPRIHAQLSGGGFRGGLTAMTCMGPWQQGQHSEGLGMAGRLAMITRRTNCT